MTELREFIKANNFDLLALFKQYDSDKSLFLSIEEFY